MDRKTKIIHWLDEVSESEYEAILVLLDALTWSRDTEEFAKCRINEIKSNIDITRYLEDSMEVVLREHDCYCTENCVRVNIPPFTESKSWAWLTYPVTVQKRLPVDEKINFRINMRNGSTWSFHGIITNLTSTCYDIHVVHQPGDSCAMTRMLP